MPAFMKHEEYGAFIAKFAEEQKAVHGRVRHHRGLMLRAEGRRMTRDTGVALGLIALAGLYWLGADQIRVSRLEGIVGAQAVPKGLAVSLAILSVLLMAQDLLRTAPGWRPRPRVRKAR